MAQGPTRPRVGRTDARPPGSHGAHTANYSTHAGPDDSISSSARYLFPLSAGAVERAKLLYATFDAAGIARMTTCGRSPTSMLCAGPAHTLLLKPRQTDHDPQMLRAQGTCGSHAALSDAWVLMILRAR